MCFSKEGVRNFILKKIAFLVPSLGHAGAEKSFLRVINSIEEDGNEVSVIVFSSHLNLENQLNKKIRLIILNGKTSNPFFLIRLHFLLKKIAPEVIFGWSLFANLAGLLVKPSKPTSRVVISERNYFPTTFELEENKFIYCKYKITLALIKKLYPKADLITANSLINLRFLKLFIGKGPRYELLPNSIDLSDVEEKSNEFNIDQTPENVLRIISVGRLEFQKGFDILLKAVNLIKDKITFQLLIIGDGSLKHNLEKLRDQLKLNDTVKFEGFKPNPFPYYKWADIYILSSRFEGFPNVLVEAMACGKACIASDCKTGPYELTEMGKLGLLYAVDDYHALASAIIRLAKDPELRIRLGQLGKAKIEHEYDYSRMKNLYAAILK